MDQLRIEHQRFVLDNGLTLIVHEDHSVPIVAVNLWYHVGSRNEKPGKTGFAHLFEHFFFNGSEHHPSGFREAMDDIGANNRNGTTNVDRTNFFEDVPTSALERTLFLEADRMGFLAGQITEESLTREKGVVKNEKRRGENQPYGRAFTRILESVYPSSHPYSWPTIGRTEDLDAATLHDVQEWYKAFYGPNNCVLSLAGDITPQRALQLVEKYFGAIPPNPPVQRYQRWIPRFDGNVRDVMQDRVPQTRFYRFYHTPSWGETESQHLRLAASVLSGSKSSRLDRSLIYEKELATSVAAFVLEREIAGGFIVLVTVKPGVDPGEAEREVDAILQKFLEDGPSSEELERARFRFLAGFVRGMERLGGFGGRSDILAENATYGGDPHAYLDHFKILNEATPELVRDSSRKWLKAHHYTLSVVPFPKLKPGKDDIDRSIVPALAEAPSVDFPQVRTATLSNGLRVLLMERHTAPLVNLSLVVDAGYSADPIGRPGIASLALDLMQEGTKTRDGFRIIDELDSLGASISTASSLDQSFVRLRALKMNFEASLEVFADVVLNPAFKEDVVQIGKRRRLARIGQEKARPVSIALRIAPRLLYGEGHAYSNPLTGSGYLSSVEKIVRDDLAEWHQAWFHPNNATLIVAGDIELAELKRALEKGFSGWAQGQAPKKNVPTVDAAKPTKVYLIDKPGAPQSVIVASHLSQPGGRPGDLAMETAMRLFGGMSTSRLNRNLRLDKHWSYGASGQLLNARGQRPFLVIAAVQSDKTKESMIELTREIRGIAGDRPIVGEEFKSIKRNMVLRLPGRFETLSSLEGAATSMVNLGYPADYYYDYAKNVRKLTEEDLAAAAGRFIDPDKLIWIVIGDLASVEQGIRELAYGEVIRLDPDGVPAG